MTISYIQWFISSFLLRSNEYIMIAMLKKSFIERQNTHRCQRISWSSQVLSRKYAIGWWAINPTKQDRIIFPSISFHDHHIFRYNLSLEQKFLFSKLKSALLCMLADNGINDTPVLANAQYCLLRDISTPICFAIWMLCLSYISLSLVGQRPTEKVSANQELARCFSQEEMNYGIQLPPTSRSFFCGKFQKFLSSSVHWISHYQGVPIVLQSHSCCLH